LGAELHRLTGVDLLAVPGINHVSALQIIGEIGLDMTQWKNAKQFASWLGLCPGNKVSGGKRLSGKTKPSNNRAAATLRMAAFTLYRSQTSLGAYLRRLKSGSCPQKFKKKRNLRKKAAEFGFNLVESTKTIKIKSA